MQLLRSLVKCWKKHFVLPTDPLNLTTTGDAKEKEQKAIIANDLTVACLTMSFTEPEDLEYVDDSATSNYPNGIAK